MKRKKKICAKLNRMHGGGGGSTSDVSFPFIKLWMCVCVFVSVVLFVISRFKLLLSLIGFLSFFVFHFSLLRRRSSLFLGRLRTMPCQRRRIKISQSTLRLHTYTNSQTGEKYCSRNCEQWNKCRKWCYQKTSDYFGESHRHHSKAKANCDQIDARQWIGQAQISGELFFLFWFCLRIASLGVDAHVCVDSSTRRVAPALGISNGNDGFFFSVFHFVFCMRLRWSLERVAWSRPHCVWTIISARSRNCVKSKRNVSRSWRKSETYGRPKCSNWSPKKTIWPIT